MKIEEFSNFVSTELKPMVLQDTAVVADGTAFFSKSYQDSGLTHQMGCESNLYAKYLRIFLDMFRRAKVKCYFLFEGTQHEKLDKLKEKDETPEHRRPIFMRHIYREVLTEMGFDFVVCEYESKRDVIALSQKLDCPIISDDMEFYFSGQAYIPRPELKYNRNGNAIQCRYFLLENFLEKYNLTEDLLAIFIVLTNTQGFPAKLCTKFFQHIRAPPAQNHHKRYSYLLQWLSKHTKQQSWKTLQMCMTKDDYNNFSALLSKMRLQIARREAGGVGAAWLTLGGVPSAAGTGNWFPAGVAARHVSVDHITLYRKKRLDGSRVTTPVTCEDDAMYLSLDIAKYALDLLTDFNNDGFVFVSDTRSGPESITYASSIRKPDYEAKVSVFENGWSEVRHLGLLEHFLRESLQRAELRALGWAPRGARLLLAALLYFARRKQEDTSAEAAAVLLSYVMLSTVFERVDVENLPRGPFDRKPILSPTTDKDDVTEEDCKIAAVVMEDYVSTTNWEAGVIYEEELYYPLVQFQYCLRQLVDLNALCGAPLAPLELRRAYAGPLVYKLRRAMRGAPPPPRCFLNYLLSPAPTVLAFLNGLIDVYESML